MKFLFICLVASMASSDAGLVSLGHSTSFHSTPLIDAHHHAHLTNIAQLNTHAHAIHTIPLAQAAPLAQVSSLVHSPPLNQLNAAHLVHIAAPAQVPLSPFVHEILPQPIPVHVQHHPIALHAAPAVAVAQLPVQPLHTSVLGHYSRANILSAPSTFDLHHHHHHHATAFAAPTTIIKHLHTPALAF